jgi:hypothetical protein
VLWPGTPTISTVLHYLTPFEGLTTRTSCLILCATFEGPSRRFFSLGRLTVQPAKINVQHSSANLWVDVLLAAVVVLSLGSLLYRLMN